MLAFGNLSIKHCCSRVRPSWRAKVQNANVLWPRWYKTVMLRLLVLACLIAKIGFFFDFSLIGNVIFNRLHLHFILYSSSCSNILLGDILSWYVYRPVKLQLPTHRLRRLLYMYSNQIACGTCNSSEVNCLVYLSVCMWSSVAAVAREPQNLQHTFIIISNNITARLSWDEPPDSESLVLSGYRVIWGQLVQSDPIQMDSDALTKVLPKVCANYLTTAYCGVCIVWQLLWNCPIC